MTWEGLSPPYGTIVADPPWPFLYGGGPGGRRTPRPKKRLAYTVTTVNEIAALPVGDLAAIDCTLFMWATREVYREGDAARVARSWGFEPCGDLIWEKPNMGTGAWPRPTHEPILIARRGHPPTPTDRGFRSVQRWKHYYGTNNGKTHSAKPSGFGDAVEANFPGPYVELFARAPRLGWDHWGHGYEIGAAS